MTQVEMEALLEEEVKGLSSFLDNVDFVNACDNAERETGWSFPTTDDFRIHWLKERAKRDLFFMLLTESASKFKYKQINLQHRFDHYKVLLDIMDQQFIAVQEDRPEKFANVDTFRIFGTKIDAGFSYEPETGVDLTYRRSNVVIQSPGK